MQQEISIAIETSCRAGGVALALSERVVEVVAFDASRRHAGQLISHLEGLLQRAALAPKDLSHVYVSAGPGSFTGLRIGITVARTLAQVLPRLRCVAVPTVLAIAENVRGMQFENLAVVLDAREGCIYTVLLQRQAGRIVPVSPARLLRPQEFLDSAPRPLLLTGEELGYHDLSGAGIEQADPSLHLPTAEGVWKVGRRMAQAGEFTDYSRLLPIYTRKPKVLLESKAKTHKEEASDDRPAI